MSSTILGARIHGVTMDEALNRIAEFIQSGSPHQVITLNAEILYRATKEPALLELINRADLVTPDGAGIVWAAKKLGRPVPERVTGIDLLQAVAHKAPEAGWRLFLYGGEPGVAELAAANLRKKHPGLMIVGTAHGFIPPEEQEQLREQISRSRPHLLLVALGAPRQEFWIRDNLPSLGVPVAIGVGGSFDVIAGLARRAPGWIQKAQLEWLYRLVKEPWRYKRMLALPRFMSLVLRESRR
jgi:N-acetylglucosaminyldiphosphoundecaprenol N-acetyl-beta-D-mannosaminyltransferase